MTRFADAPAERLSEAGYSPVIEQEPGFLRIRIRPDLGLDFEGPGLAYFGCEDAGDLETGLLEYDGVSRVTQGSALRVAHPDGRVRREAFQSLVRDLHPIPDPGGSAD